MQKPICPMSIPLLLKYLEFAICIDTCTCKWSSG